MVKKYMIILLVSAIWMSGGILIPAAPAAAAGAVGNDYGYYRGDVDGDGELFASDARLILRAHRSRYALRRQHLQMG